MNNCRKQAGTCEHGHYYFLGKRGQKEAARWIWCFVVIGVGLIAYCFQYLIYGE